MSTGEKLKILVRRPYQSVTRGQRDYPDHWVIQSSSSDSSRENK